MIVSQSIVPDEPLTECFKAKLNWYDSLYQIVWLKYLILTKPTGV
jgi:hypothetical protein